MGDESLTMIMAMAVAMMIQTHFRGQWRSEGNTQQQQDSARHSRTQNRAEEHTQQGHRLENPSLSPTSSSSKHIIRIEPQHQKLSHGELALALL